MSFSIMFGFEPSQYWPYTRPFQRYQAWKACYIYQVGPFEI